MGNILSRWRQRREEALRQKKLLHTLDALAAVVTTFQTLLASQSHTADVTLLDDATLQTLRDTPVSSSSWKQLDDEAYRIQRKLREILPIRRGDADFCTYYYACDELETIISYARNEGVVAEDNVAVSHRCGRLYYDVGEPIIYLRANGIHRVCVELTQEVRDVVTSPVCGVVDDKLTWVVKASDDGATLRDLTTDATAAAATTSGEVYSCLFYEMSVNCALYSEDLPSVYVTDLREAAKMLRWLMTALGLTVAERDNAVNFWLPSLANGGTIVNATQPYDGAFPLVVTNVLTKRRLPTKRISLGIAPQRRLVGAVDANDVLRGGTVFFVPAMCDAEHAIEWGGFLIPDSVGRDELAS